MNLTKKHIISIALLLLIALLIVLQIIWQKQAYDIEKKDYYIRVLYALNKVRAKLKNANSCVTFFSKPGFMPNEGMYILKQKFNAAGYYGKTDTIHLFLDKDSIKKKNEIDYKYSNYKSSLATYAELTLNIIYSPSDTVNLLDGNENNYKDIIKSKNNIHDFFDTSSIHSFIKEKLSEENIEDSFGFGFVDIETDHINLLHGITDSQQVLKSTFGIDVFRNDPFIAPQRLAVVFKDAEISYFALSPALLSIVVIILLCGLLFSLYQFFQKQKKLSDLKSEFIQNLNHEMNTPITNIQLALEWMKQYVDQSDPEIIKLNEIILSESTRLQQNIDRSLQIGQLENKTLFLDKKFEDVEIIVKDICEIFKSYVSQIDGIIQFTSCGSRPALLDKIHVSNCISSILDNAIKYRSKERKLEIHCQLTASTTHTIISIKDNGRGMTNDVMRYVFEKFYREDSKLVHNTKGFGIGLSYVKAVIEMHDGEVSVKSDLNKGSIFEIKIPS